MKQLIIRLVSPECPVYSVSYGSIVDGQFTPADIEEAPAAVKEYVVKSELFGSQGYLPRRVGVPFVRALGDKLDDFDVYPNFVVFHIDDHEKSEEKNA